MLQILLSAGGPVWSEEQRIEGARCSWGEEAEEGAPSLALGLSRMRERKELVHWRVATVQRKRWLSHFQLQPRWLGPFDLRGTDGRTDSVG